MDDRDLTQLYDEAILRESRHPYHYERMSEADHTIEAYNPICGDEFRIYLFLSEDRIVRAYFHGYGCAVSKASTSVLVRQLEGLTRAEAVAHTRHFLDWIQSEDNAERELWSPFAAARAFPERLSCATLSWQAIADVA